MDEVIKIPETLNEMNLRISEIGLEIAQINKQFGTLSKFRDATERKALSKKLEKKRGELFIVKKVRAEKIKRDDEQLKIVKVCLPNYSKSGLCADDVITDLQNAINNIMRKENLWESDSEEVKQLKEARTQANNFLRNLEFV